MPAVSMTTRLRIIEEYKIQGWAPTKITKTLKERNYSVSKTSVLRILQRYSTTGSINDLSGRGRVSTVTYSALEIIQRSLAENSETTTKDLKKILSSYGLEYSCYTIVRARRKLGWIYGNARYCQHVRPKNIELRLQWATRMVEEIKKGFRFEDVIFTDESKIQMETYTKKCYRRIGCRAELKGRFKHPQSVLVWGGISRRGRTNLIIFQGIMDADFYVNHVLTKGLLVFGETRYNSEYRLMQDNDPKHTSVKAKQFYENLGINWWKTPAESPDINPIENLWAEMKNYIRRTKKPSTLQELIDGLNEFWATVDVAKCNKYIDHLYKVIPAIVNVNGYPTGY